MMNTYSAIGLLNKMCDYKPGDEPVEGYKLTNRRGSGAFGVVWEATGPGGVPCALKIISDLRNRGGSKEFKSLALLREIRHINLVDIRGFWVKSKPGLDGHVIGDYSELPHSENLDPNEGSTSQKDGLGQKTEVFGAKEWGHEAEELVIAMGLCDTSLEDELKKHPNGIPVERLINYMSGAAEAIDHVNNHGIQHCDIKPGNILLLGNHAQVCDFGLAQEIGDNTHATSIAASPAYADPTVLEGDDPVETTDLYCLAMTYAELRTGRLPFKKTVARRSQVLKAKKTVDFDLTGIPEAEQEILLGALAPNPNDRRFLGEHKAKWFVEGLRSAIIGDDIEGIENESAPTNFVPAVLLGVVATALIVFAFGWILSPPSDVEALGLLKVAKYEEAAQAAEEIRDNLVRETTLENVAKQWHKNALQYTDPGRKLETYQRILRYVPFHQATREARKRDLQEIVQSNQIGVERILESVQGIAEDDCKDQIDRLWIDWLVSGEIAPKLLQKLGRRVAILDDHAHGEADIVDKLLSLAYAYQSPRQSSERLLEALLQQKNEIGLSDLVQLIKKRDALPKRSDAILDPIFDHVLDEYVTEPVRFAEAKNSIEKLVGSDTQLLREAELRALINTGQFDSAYAKLPEFSEQENLPRAVIEICDPNTSAESLQSAANVIADRRRDLLQRYAGANTPTYHYAEIVLRRAEATEVTPDLGEYILEVIQSNATQPLSNAQQSILANILVDIAEQNRLQNTTDLSNIMVMETAIQSQLFLEAAVAVHGSHESRAWRELAIATFFSSTSGDSLEKLETVVSHVQHFRSASTSDIPLDLDYVNCRALLGIRELRPNSTDLFDELLASAGRLVANWDVVARGEKIAAPKRLARRRVFYDSIVMPVIQQIDSRQGKSIPSAQQAVAALKNFQADTILRDFGLRRDVGYEVASSLAKKAAKQSASLDRSNPAYLITYGQVLVTWHSDISKLPGQIRKLGIQAQELCKSAAHREKLPDALGVQAYADLIESRQQVSVARRKAQLQKAERTFKRIVSIAAEHNYEVSPIILLNYSTCLVELAFTNPAARSKSLSNAEALATEVIENLFNDPEFDAAEAYLTRGNAREDLAYYLCKRSKYGEAANDFESAFNQATLHNLNDLTADRSRLAHARCLFRWADDENELAQRLARFQKASGLLGVSRHRSGDVRLKSREQMWRGKTLSRIARIRKSSEKDAVSQLATAAANAWERDQENWLAYQAAYLAALVESSASTKNASEKVAEKSKQVIGDKRLRQFAGQPGLIGQIFEVFVTARLQAVRDSPSKQRFMDASSEFRNLLPNARLLCPEAESELLLGQLEAGHKAHTVKQMSQIWKRYEATFAGLSEPRRAYRGLLSISRYHYENGSLEQATKFFSDVLPWIRHRGCRNELERKKLLAEAAIRLGTMQLRAGSHRDAEIAAVALGLLSDDKLRSVLIEKIGKESILDMLIKKLSAI